MRLFTKITLSFFLISFIIICSISIVNFIHTRNLVEKEISNKISAISKTLAQNINLTKKNLNENINKLCKDLDLAFIVIIDKDKKRLSHPNKELIGKLVEGEDSDEALNGKHYISIAKGSLKRSIRSFSPIYKDEKIVGAVIVGVFSDYLDILTFNENKINLYLSIFFILLILLLSVLLNKNIKNILLGYEPKQFRLLLQRQNAILKSLNEGIIAIDNKNTITLINDEAKKIFKLALLEDDLIGKNVDEKIPHSNMSEVLKTKKAQINKKQKLNDITILTNRIPYFIDGKIAGVVASFKNLKDVEKIANKLVNTKKYLDILSANHHEFKNKLHIINALLENNNIKQCKKYLEEISYKQSTNTKSLECFIKDKIILTFLESKFNFIKEFKVDIILDKNSFLNPINNVLLQNDIISILSNTIDNALDALQHTNNKKIKVFIKNNKKYLCIKVSDNANKLKDCEKIFTKGYSSKGENRGYGLFICSEIANKNNGFISVKSHNKDTVFSIFTTLKEEND
ncbi:ATP-binding protein [Campylobacter canadensis]|uniref:ATP-binding protein n=1 Tax=Campylobacter canadensis TaxID=449520 RepID=UPI001CCB11ED|nr:GHKL domain-containing protein [Campylobacter canadensis]MBZ7997933.1 GHKL domain-containing protein [Campylobacter canadensis]